MKKLDTVEFCLKRIKDIQQQYVELSKNRKNAYAFYMSDSNIVPAPEGRSKITTSDLHDIVEWSKPALLELLAGNKEIFSITPVTPEDVEPCNNMTLLVNHQLRVKNNWYLIMHDWLHDAMLAKIGVLKYQWFVNKKTFKKTYEGLTKEELTAILSNPDVNVDEVEEIPISDAVYDEAGTMISPPMFKYNATVLQVVEDEYPLLEVIPPEDFGCPVDCTDIDEADFVYHHTRLNRWKVKELYGEKKLKEIDNAIAEIDAGYSEKRERLRDLGNIIMYDENLRKYHIYECYFRDEETGTPMIVTICGNVILKEEENLYGRPPFRVIPLVKLSHRLYGLSFYDIIKDLQRLRTELIRQIMDNIYQANYRRYFVDIDRVNLDDYLNNNVTNAMVRVRGNPQDAVFPEVKAPLPQEVFTFLEMLNIEKDYHSGVPRAYQGVLPSVQHRTFRGQAQQVQLASQRIQMIARMVAEMGISPLINDIIDMNLKFLNKKTVVRYLNKYVEISPDNIVGKFDIAVNVGLGTSTKENLVIQMQQLLGIYAQLYKAGVPVATANNVYNIIKTMLEGMNIKNAFDYVTDPQQVDVISQLVQAIMPVVQQMPQLMPLVQQVMSVFGINPESLAAISGKTQKEQVVAEQPQTPQPPVPPILATPTQEWQP